MLVRGRETAKRIDALCLDASARAASGCTRARIGLFDERSMRNIVRTVHSGTGSQRPSGARGIAVAYAGDREKVFRDGDGSSEAERRREPEAAGSSPVRFTTG
ncbi:hypothetical protein GCM10027430_32200 [Lysobacter tyrosinilyticus]